MVLFHRRNALLLGASMLLAAGVTFAISFSTAPDPTFGTDGLATPLIDADATYIASMANANGGGYLITGHANGDGYVARLDDAGLLDTAFAAPDGFRTIDVANCIDPLAEASANAFTQVTQLAGGGIIAAGQAVTSTPSGETRFALTKLTSSGNPDTSFGNNGCVIVDAHPDRDAELLTSLAVQPDGRLLLAGWAWDSTTLDADAVLVRLNADGSPDDGSVSDTTPLDDFAGDGRFALPSYNGARALSIPAERTAVGLQSDGSIVMGYTTATLEFGVARLDPDGTLDPSFGAAGLFSAPVETDRDAWSADLVVLDDDRIVIGGTTANADGLLDFALMGVSADGVLDVAFGAEAGTSTVSLSLVDGNDHLMDIDVDSAGRIVAGGAYLVMNPASQRAAMARFLQDGTLDAEGLCEHGVILTNINGSIALLVDPEDRILTGFRDPVALAVSGDIGIARFFGGDGIGLCVYADRDGTPDSFSFTDRYAVALDADIESDAVTITGINTEVSIAVANGSYSIGCTGTWTSAAGTIGNNTQVCVQHRSADTYGAVTSTVLSVGGVSDTFTSLTESSPSPGTDTSPDPFTFTDASIVALATLQTSLPVTVTGINYPTPISVSGGAFSVGCTDTFTTTGTTIRNGQVVCVRHTSAPTCATYRNTILTIGGVSDTFSSRTIDDSADADGDGVSDCFDQVPNDATVATPRTGAGQQLTISTASGQLAAVTWLDPDALSDTRGLPAGTVLPYGLLSWRVEGLVPGSSAVVTLTFPVLTDAVIHYKYTDATGFARADTLAVINVENRTVTLSLVDGGAGDADGLANGIIEDPYALAVPPISTSGGGSSGGGCALRSGDPERPDPLLPLLVLLAGWHLFTRRRARPAA